MRVFSSAAFVLGVFSLAQAGWAQNTTNQVKGKYAFTLAEKCVHQLGLSPGFDSTTLAITDSHGAETYSGSSDGIMTFDGIGGVTVTEAHATNIMNASDRLVQPGIITPIPIGFGIGADLFFTCVGTYSVSSAGQITMALTCTADLSDHQPNVFGASGFISQFNMRGWVPQNPDHLVLTDPGKTVQPVTITFVNGMPSISQQRICTRSTNLVLLGPK